MRGKRVRGCESRAARECGIPAPPRGHLSRNARSAYSERSSGAGRDVASFRLDHGVVGSPLGPFEIAVAEVTTLGYGVHDVGVGWAAEVGADFDGHGGSLSSVSLFALERSGISVKVTCQGLE